MVFLQCDSLEETSASSTDLAVGRFAVVGPEWPGVVQVLEQEVLGVSLLGWAEQSAACFPRRP